MNPILYYIIVSYPATIPAVFLVSLVEALSVRNIKFIPGHHVDWTATAMLMVVKSIFWPFWVIYLGGILLEGGDINDVE